MATVRATGWANDGVEPPPGASDCGGVPPGATAPIPGQAKPRPAKPRPAKPRPGRRLGQLPSGLRPGPPCRPIPRPGGRAGIRVRRRRRSRQRQPRPLRRARSAIGAARPSVRRPGSAGAGLGATGWCRGRAVGLPRACPRGGRSRRRRGGRARRRMPAAAADGLRGRPGPGPRAGRDRVGVEVEGARVAAGEDRVERIERAGLLVGEVVAVSVRTPHRRPPGVARLPGRGGSPRSRRCSRAPSRARRSRAARGT